MSVFLSKLFSILFHPILMPLFSIWLILHTRGDFIRYQSQGQSMSFSEEGIGLIYLLFFLITVAMPVLSIFILLRQGLISKLSMPHRKERTMPYLITLFYYCMLYFFMQSKNFPDIFLSALLGCIVTLVLVLLINLKIKISSHSSGIAGVCGVYAAFMKHGLIPDGILVLTMLIILTGFISTSRLSLNAHRDNEVYIGIILGFTVEFVFTNYTIFI
jgi:hypothetical protein